MFMKLKINLNGFLLVKNYEKKSNFFVKNEFNERSKGQLERKHLSNELSGLSEFILEK